MPEHTDPPPKPLTVHEANALLPRVEPLVKQLQGLHHSILKTNREMDGVIAKLSAGNGYPIKSLKEQLEALTKHQLQLIEAYQSAAAQLEALGALLKDAEKGLIDFCGMRKGQMIFLCWVVGEERIRFWHTLEDGFAGRRPLD